MNTSSQPEVLEGQLRIRLRDDCGEREVIATIIERGVLKGTSWLPGIQIDEESLLAECVVSSMMEGGMLFDTWEADPELCSPEMSFTVIQARSDDLARLELLAAALPPDATIRTEDGYVLRLRNGVITDGDVEFTSMSDIGVAFVIS